ncbi:tetratricopeptide repeat protein [Streptomyces hokutonensis]|uniref:tetratricopeptide repeat protein n=1 Tax=Streptomyces hokutonensis TaxID=1306990 RepID=UPI00369B60DE
MEYLLLAGDVGQAVELTDTVRGLQQTAQQQHVLGRLALESGRQDEARREFTAAWRSRSADTEPETVQCIAEQMAWLCLIQSDGHGAVSWGRRGLDTGPGDRAWLLRDELTPGLALTGQFDEGLQAVRTCPNTAPTGVPRNWTGCSPAARCTCGTGSTTPPAAT